jgi:peptidoglycan hydrolase-like protein with peptidoglycan-binding domain
MNASSLARFGVLLTITLVVGVNTVSATAPTATTHKKTSGMKAAGAKSSAKPRPSASTKSAAHNSAARNSSAKTSGKPTSAVSARTTVRSSAVAGKSPSIAKSSSKKSGRRSGLKSASSRQRGQMAPTPERITEIQEALAKNGALGSSPSGKWDDSTTEAMKRFQTAHGFNPSGRLDARSLNVLGLGSATAGIAAPAPSIRTSAVAVPSDIQQ